jgi:Phasin protein
MAPPIEPPKARHETRRPAAARRKAGAARANPTGSGPGSTPPDNREQTASPPAASAPAPAVPPRRSEPEREPSAEARPAAPLEQERQGPGEPWVARAPEPEPQVRAEHVPTEPEAGSATKDAPARSVAAAPVGAPPAPPQVSVPSEIAAVDRADEPPAEVPPRAARRTPWGGPSDGEQVPATPPAAGALRTGDAVLSLAAGWRDEVLDLLREEVEQGLAASRALAQCRSPQAALTVQADYLGRALARGSERGQRLMRLWVATASDPGGAFRRP